MISKIINMAERIKDAEDRLLESLFESAPLADDGFSAKVVKKVSRRLWIRRVTLPTAGAIGAAFAIKPLAGLVSALSSIASLVPQDLVSATTGALPQMQMVVMGAVLLAVCLLATRALSD